MDVEKKRQREQETVAKIIEGRSGLGATRQLFFVSLGGFDTLNDQLNQQQVDRIVERACHAGFDARVRLAKLACEESGLGVWQDKVLKNVLATQLVYDNIKNEKICARIMLIKLRNMQKM